MSEADDRKERERKERLAAALRTNLRRRKAQAREVRAESVETPELKD